MDGVLILLDYLKGGAAQLPRPVPAPRRPARVRPGRRRRTGRRGNITESGTTLPSGIRIIVGDQISIWKLGSKVRDVWKTAVLAVCGLP